MNLNIGASENDFRMEYEFDYYFENENNDKSLYSINYSDSKLL